MKKLWKSFVEKRKIKRRMEIAAVVKALQIQSQQQQQEDLKSKRAYIFDTENMTTKYDIIKAFELLNTKMTLYFDEKEFEEFSKIIKPKK